MSMNKSIKQIYVALEISENDLKILVAEYFNTRFNILRAEKTPTKAINNYKIVDKNILINEITTLVNNASEKIGAKIEKVILVLPSYNFKRISLKSVVVPEEGYVKNSDIVRAISNSLKSKIDDGLMVYNAMPIKYTINGLSTRRIPEKEVCNEMIVDIDLLCADKNVAFDYVSCVEECGINVLDIVLNTYAIGKEASLFEESLKQNLICLDINKTCTYMSLFSKGKLASTELIFEGINTLANDFKKQHNVPYEDLIKLLKFDVNYDCKYPDDIIYAYNKDSHTVTITTTEINNLCLNQLNAYTDNIITMCKPIIDEGALLFITGEGQQMNALVEMLKSKASCEVKSYYPDTIGVRDPSFTAIYGSLFAYKEKVLLNKISISCIDLLSYDSYIDQKQLDAEGETITTKIKNLFKQYIEKEDGE